MGTSAGALRAWETKRAKGLVVPWNKGIPRTEEEKEHIGSAIKAYYSTHKGHGNKQPRSEGLKKYLSQLYKGEGNPFSGRHHTEEARKLISEKASHPKPYLRGENSGMFGRHFKHTEEMKEYLSVVKRQQWADEDFRNRTVEASMRARDLRPNGVERRMIGIIERHHLPYKYTGDGSFILHGFNPDFIDCNSKKIALEVFGDYWHKKHASSRRIANTVRGRTAIFRDYGWQLIIFWESELNSPDAEELVLSRISEVKHG